MHTAEEYFAALEACLKQMPAADRAQTITYYREYAQEGGLLDAEQLREHFGPPEALAARILEDEAGKYPQEPPKSAGRKGVHLIPVLLGSFIAVVVAASALLAALHPQNTVEGPLPTDNAPAPQSTDAASLADGKDADGTLAMDAASGSARIEGTVAEQVRVEMISGNIFVTAADPAVTAEGDSIQYNGQRVGKISWSRQGSGCTLILETSSGSVSIQTP